MNDILIQQQHLTVERKQTIQLMKRDVLALKWICEQGAMTVEQLWEAVWKAGDSNSQSYAYRRVHNLERTGYLHSLSSPLLPVRFLAVTVKARDAVRFKENRHVPLMTPPISQLVHVQRLTDLRLLISKHGKLSAWQSERSLLIDPLFPKHRFREHLPDALWVNPGRSRILIEYERARKSNPRVRRKVEAYSREMARIDRFMDHVLWIVEPERLSLFRQVVRGEENQTVRTMDEFQTELRG